MKRKLILMLVFILESRIANSSEIPDPASVNAYKQYWNNFDQYESSRINDSKETISQAWDQLKQEFHHNKRSMSEKQLNSLRSAASKYRDHLEQHSDAQNTPYVLLNLAQILNKIGAHYQEFDSTAGVQYRSEALEVLTDIGKRYPDFEKREEVLYLKATTLDSIDQKESASQVWKFLSKIAKKTLYGAHANIAIGDYDFSQERSLSALSSYKKAYKIIRNLRTSNVDYETLRIQYRIAWAAYRSAELGQCIGTAIQLLQPGRPMKKLSLKKSIEEDAIELIGDALYEKNDMDYMKAVLGRKVLRNHSSAIALRILKRYLSGEIYTDIIELGEFVSKRFPRSRNIPDILTILAESYKKKEQENGYLQSLEKLSLLLPKKSLWRTQYQNEYETISNMEQKALAAAEILAAHYYRLGMINASTSSFITASSYYQILVNFDPNHKKANSWRLKMGNSYYFSSKLGSAKSSYDGLINQQKIDQPTLQIAAYQMVLTYEKIWREEFGKRLSKSKKPYKDPIVLQHLSDFENAVESFSNRFPTSKFSNEALLKVASANRDMQRLDQASTYWQRTLISNPNYDQRSLAIRGIVYYKVQKKNHMDIIETVSKFLKLEKWSKLGSGLNRELESILSQAVRNASDHLNSKGEVLEAGNLLIKISEDFPRIPDRDALYRDGIYMLAIAGDWSNSLKHCEIGLSSKRFKYKGDLAYLKARSLEYQMRFKLASKAYLEVARRYPNHSRAFVALSKTETLAIAEDDIETAAKANVLMAEMSKGKDKRYKHYKKAAVFYSQIDESQKSLKFGKRALANAKSRDEKFEIRLINAKQRYALGSEEQALQEFNSIRKDVQRNKDRIDYETYSTTLGESSFLLGEEQRAIFTDFRVKERQGTWTNNVKEKVARYERLYAAYGSAIKSGHPLWSSQSRYYLGRSAEKFSQEINEGIISDDNLRESVRDKLKQQSSRFKKLAKQFYSDNIMERNRRPKAYRNNPWIKKSMIKLSGFHDNGLLNINDEKLPYSMGSTMPQQWSM